MKFLIISTMFFLLQANCSTNASMDNLNARISNLENKKISSETAILIAKGKMMKTTDLKKYEISLREGIDFWEVHFSAKCAGCLDGKSYVVVNKTNGEIIRKYPYGKPAE